MARRPGRPARLDRDQIVAAALTLDLDTLSMPAVAHRLGVSTQALYYWVANRDALLDLIGEYVAERITPKGVAAGGDWRAWLDELAWHMFREILAIPGYAGRVFNRPHATTAHLKLHSHIVEVLVGAGLEERTAMDTWDIFGTCVLGWLAAQQQRDTTSGTDDDPPGQLPYPPRDSRTLTDTVEQRFAVLVDTLLRGLPARPRHA